MACKSFLKISVMSRNMGVFLSTFLIKSLKDQASSNLTLELIYLHVMQIFTATTHMGRRDNVMIRGKASKAGTIIEIQRSIV